jgi:assimilatory nitrate reductase catalytic subunit
MPTLFPYASADEIFREHVATTAGATSTSRVSRMRCSMPAARSSGRSRPARPRAASGFTPTGCSPRRTAGRASPTFAYVPVAEKPDARYPFRLNTGRLRDQWHGMSRTGTVAQLFQNAGEPRLQLSAGDLARRGLRTGDLVRVESKRGQIIVPVEACDELKPAMLSCRCIGAVRPWAAKGRAASTPSPRGRAVPFPNSRN